MRRLLSLGIVDRTQRAVAWLGGWGSLSVASAAAGVGAAALVALVLLAVVAARLHGVGRH